MKPKYDFLPRRFTKEEIALSPIAWRKSISDYSNFRKKALKESRPGTYTLLVTLLTAIVKRDRDLIDVAARLTKDNIPKHFYLYLISSALRCFGEKDEGMSMLTEAVKVDPSHSMTISLATNIDNLDEKERLAEEFLSTNPEESEAVRQLAYAKYFKGEKEEAEELINRILQKDPNNIYALEFKGNVCFDRNEYQKALEQYLQIKRSMKPTPVSLAFKICNCYYLVGKVSKAKKIAKKIKDKITLAYDIECGLEKAQQILTDILNT